MINKFVVAAETRWLSELFNLLTEIKKTAAFMMSLFAVALISHSASASQVFSDDLEGGSANWSVLPGNTALQYVSNTTDPNANHTIGGSYALKMSQPSDRVYHDIDVSPYPNATVKFGAWFYDTLDTRPFSFEPFDIRSASNSQVLGIGAYYADTFYDTRILTAANGSAGPNWQSTTVSRSAGWHHFELIQYRGAQAGKAEFFIDGILARTTTNAFDATLNRIVLGLGFAANNFQSGYVDDISFEVIPEPATFSLCLLAVMAAGMRSGRRTRKF